MVPHHLLFDSTDPARAAAVVRSARSAQAAKAAKVAEAAKRASDLAMASGGLKEEAFFFRQGGKLPNLHSRMPTVA